MVTSAEDAENYYESQRSVKAAQNAAFEGAQVAEVVHTKMKFPISQFDDELCLMICTISFTKLLINSSIATTGHTLLQGMSQNT